MKKKRKLGRKLLGFLLTLAMVVGLVPGMNITVHAETYSDTVYASELKEGDILAAGTTIVLEDEKTFKLQANGWCLENGTASQGDVNISSGSINVSSEGTITISTISDVKFYPYANGTKVDKWEVISVESDVITLVGYDGITKYPLWVGGIRVTSANADNIDGQSKASYDVTTNTLTLDNYIYEGTGYKFNNSYAGIYYRPNDYEQNLTINLKGTNSVTCRPPHEEEVSLTSINGIYFDNYSNMIIKGDGTLTSMIDIQYVYDVNQTYSIRVSGNLFIEKEAKVVANVSQSNGHENVGVYTKGGKITVNGTLEIKGEQEIGICMDAGNGQMTVTGTLIASGADRAFSINFNDPFQYTVPEGYTVTESGNVDGTDATPVSVGNNTSASAKYVKIMPTPKDPVSYMAWDETEKKLVEKTGDDACKEYVVVTADTTTFEDGKWYVVKDTTVTVNNRINVNGTAHLILCDGTTLIASNGITVTESNSLTIYGQSEGTGTLTATGGEIYEDIKYAGIGGCAEYNSSEYSYENGTGGTITINGGTVTASGGKGSAAIGGGQNGAGGTITINGGTVTASGNYAAGIGGGDGGAGGTIIINGGNVTANGGSYGSGRAGIGCGYYGNGGTVTINGGEVKAYGGHAGGENDDGGVGVGGDNVTVTINGGTVIAQGEKNTVGIIGTLALGAGVKVETSTDNSTWTDTTVTPETRTKYMKTSYTPPHIHDFTYTAGTGENADTITATCKNTDGRHTGDLAATLTINAPTMTTYGQIGGGISEEATITDVNNIKGEAVIKYFNATKSGETYTKVGEALTAAPTNAGDYVAEITLGEGNNEATASVGYTIAPKPVTVTGITADNKVYDGNTEARLNCESALINGKEYEDEVSLSDSATGSFSDKNVGQGKTVTISGLALTGNDAANYTLASQPESVTADITAKSVTVTGITAENKEYNGNAIAALNCEGATITGKVAGDDLSFSIPAGLFSDKNVGNGKTVTISGLTLTGADAANYTLASQPEDTTANITAKAVTVTGITAENKIYDGSIGATLNHESATIQGKVDNDDLSYNADFATGAFSDKNVGEGKTVSISGLTLSGNDAANYVLASQPASVTADISPKPVTVSGITASDKTYDGTTDATLDCANATFNGIKDNDNLTVTATGAFEDANVGDKTVNISGLTLDGTDKGNYVLAATGQQSTATATINPKSISNATVTLDKTQLTYNGQEQSVSVTGVTTSDGITLTADDYIVSGNTQTDKGDYQVTVTGKGNFTDDATTNWKIVDKAMTVKSDNVTVTYDGEEHGIKVEVIDPANGAEVKYGTTEGTYDLDECPTVTNPGTLTVYYKVTAANYADYTGTAIVTVEKLPSTPADVTANNREYDGTEKPLVNVTGKATGGKMQYALGKDATTAPTDGWFTSIPTGTNAGTYYVWYKVVGDENHNDVEPKSLVVSINEKQQTSNGTITTDGIYCASNHPSIQAGMVIHKSNEADTVEYRWVACDSSKPGKWFEVSPWTKDNNCMNWTPEKSGAYVIVCYARVVGNEEESLIQYAFGTEYHSGIKGICQIPYSGEGGGYLIGIESYNNPNNSYQYEMLILDCSLLAQGKDAWIYTTGRCGAKGNSLWTVWQPQYGYYWTLFRIYDADGNMIDEQCFGFANVN